MSSQRGDDESRRDERDDDPAAPLLATNSAGSATSAACRLQSPAPVSSTRALLMDILKLSGPISCTTVVECTNRADTRGGRGAEQMRSGKNGGN
jgi:hypothetical protein